MFQLHSSSTSVFQLQSSPTCVFSTSLLTHVRDSTSLFTHVRVSISLLTHVFRLHSSSTCPTRPIHSCPPPRSLAGPVAELAKRAQALAPEDRPTFAALEAELGLTVATFRKDLIDVADRCYGTSKVEDKELKLSLHAKIQKRESRQTSDLSAHPRVDHLQPTTGHARVDHLQPTSGHARVDHALSPVSVGSGMTCDPRVADGPIDGSSDGSDDESLKPPNFLTQSIIQTAQKSLEARVVWHRSSTNPFDGLPTHGEWVCSRCTIANGDDVSVCVMCSSLRDATHSEWVCSKCTIANGVGDSTCVMCSSPRGA
jgi:hypothetical protein